MVDLRPDSRLFCSWHGEELSADNGVMLYIPKGFAHGFVTLREDTEVFYQMSEFYESKFARGARYDDPAFKIAWPLTEGLMISERDLAFPPFIPESHGMPA